MIVPTALPRRLGQRIARDQFLQGRPLAMPAHPLGDIFSERDLERLANGRCPRTGELADDNIAGMLTAGHYAHPNGFNVSLAEWLRRTRSRDEEIHADYKTRLRGAVRSRSAFLQVAGEVMSAYFLEVQLDFGLTYIRRQSMPTPDFRIERDDDSLAAEVKTLAGVEHLMRDCDEPCTSGHTTEGVVEKSQEPLGLFGGPVQTESRAIRKMIDEVREKKQYRSDGPNLVLLADFSRVSPFDAALDALCGDPKLAFRIRRGEPISEFQPDRRGNILCQPSKNRWLGAVGVITWLGSPECHGHFVHNAYACRRILVWALDPWPQFVPEEHAWRNAPEES